MVKIEEVKVEGFKRFLLGHTNSVHYIPKSPYQVFIGPNGSGKSAFQRLLTPYLPLPGDFYKNGNLSIKFSNHDGNVYVDSLFGKTNTYAFSLERGFNLNEGGTRTVQADLCFDHLKGTQDAFDIMTDNLKLTTMSPAKREEFLTRISGIDLDFALDRYNYSRKLLKQKIGAREEILNDLIKQEVNLVPESELDVLRNRVLEYEEELTELSLIKTERTGEVMSDEDYFKNLSFLKNSLTKQIKSNYETDHLGYGNLAIADDDRHNYENELCVLEERYRHLLEKQDADAELYYYMTVNQTNDGGLVQRISDNELKIKKLSKVLKKEIAFFGEINPADLERLTVLGERVTGYCSQINSNQFYTHSTPEIEKNRNQLNECFGQLSRGQQYLSELKHKLSHYETQTDIECPECHHRFKENVKPNTIAKTRELIQKTEVKINELNQDIKSKQVFITEASFYQTTTQSIMDLFTQSDFTKKVRTYLELNGNLLENLESTIEGINVLEDKLTLLGEINRLQLVLDDDKAILKVIEEKGLNREYAELGADLAKQRQVLELLNIEINRFRNLAVTLKDKMTAVRSAEINTDKLTNHVNKWEELQKTEIEILTNEFIDIVTEETKLAIQSINKTLNEQLLIHHQVKEYSAKLKELDLDIQALEHIVRILSPKVGMIAEQMVGFVNHFIDRMNNVISAIWTYPMEVQPGKTTGESLTYIFPVLVNDRYDDIVPDVKNASDGQMSIINYAFKITALLQMGLEGYPLHLDEVDREMTVAHKVRTMNHVRELIENEVFSQVFIISHHESCFGALPNAEIIDLSPENVLTGANSNVTFYEKAEARAE